ncbi:MAG: cellulase family glycosylhydrolase [Chloroflexi bacterium]|nr:cellulase family glycosylhydrolase [Chloroflexota bacterium]
MKAAKDAGFTHAKMVLHWPAVEPSSGNFLWKQTKENDLDNILKAARAQDMRLVVRVDEVPGWAGGSPAGANLDAVRRFYEEMTRYANGTIAGYEILNEPNLPHEWGGAPDPAGYTRFMRAAYQGAKAGDPNAIVIGGGPAPNTGGYGGTMEDVDFIRGMYAAGARGSMDAMSVHPYGGNTSYDRDPNDCGGICFRRAEMYHQLMLDLGDDSTPIWATEFGWLMDPGRGLGQYDWMKVSAQAQADNVVGSFRYALDNWPWMTGMLLSNLDASTSPYHTGWEDGMPWFALLNGDYSPRPAYSAFQAWRASIGNTTQRIGATARAGGGESAAPAAPAEDSAGPAPASDDGATRYQVANTDGAGANMRSAPNPRAALIKTLPEGAMVDYLGDTKRNGGYNWRAVRDAAGARGWVAADFLAPR